MDRKVRAKVLYQHSPIYIFSIKLKEDLATDVP